jgi:hypothetical protein
MAPPMIITPARILSFFITGGVSVGGEESESGDPSGVKEVANPSGIECCEGIDIESCESTDPSDAEKYCEDSDPSDANEYGGDIDWSEFQSADDDKWYEGVNSSWRE